MNPKPTPALVLSSKRPVLHGVLVNVAAGGVSGKKAIVKHLQPGVVRYENGDGTFTTYLLELEGIAAMRPTAAGIPVVGKSGGFDHTQIEKGKKYDGVVTDSVWDGESGWEAFNVDDMNAETAKACEKGFQASCAYIPTETDGKPGLWHNCEYDEKILNGRYTHVAIVPNPRYEGATIEILNSMPGGIMNQVLKAALSLVPIAQLREVFNSIESDDKAAAEKKEKKDKAKLDFDNSMLNATTDAEKDAAKAAFEKANAEAEAGPIADPKASIPPEPLGGGNVPPEPGMPGQNISSKPPVEPVAPVVVPNAAPVETPEEVQAREKLALEKQNAADAEAAKAKKEAEEKVEAEKKNALELKNKAEAAAKVAAERRERFNSLRKLAEDRGGNVGTTFVGVQTTQEKEDLGQARYGSR